MKNKKKRFIVVFSSVLLIFSVIVASTVTFLWIYSRNNVDSSYDEKLFSMVKGSSVTRYYYNEALDPSADYIPAEIEYTPLAENQKSWYSKDEICDALINAYICAEDREFYKHSGVNIRRTLMAAVNSFFGARRSFGASTITQQVIKNISGDNEVTVRRKISEIIRANKLERNHGKDEILEVYMNIVPMGENVVGVGRASEVYFGKTPAELTLAEAATLVGITNAPTRYNPHENKNECLEKRNNILFSMLDNGAISEAEYYSAIKEPLVVKDKITAEKNPCSWFIETVNADVISALVREKNMTESAARALVEGGGLKIYTTENPKIQNALEKYFENLYNFPKAVEAGFDSAMVVCDAQNGNLLGIVGGVGKKSGNRLLNMATAPHTPGSALKPLALYAPLVNQRRINGATVFDDVPVKFIKKGENYSEYPKNYPNVYNGLTTVKDALRHSKNTVAIRLYKMLGAENIYSILKNDYGFDTLLRREVRPDGTVLTDMAESPLALGQLSYGVSLRRLTEAYTAFSAEGKYTRGRSFVAVYDNQGRLLIDNAPKTKKVLRPEAARLMNMLLMNVTESGTASSVSLKNTVDTAGKTGTSGDDKDRLFIGYTPYFVAGIWCGYRDSGKSVGKIGFSHIKAWDDVMTEIHRTYLDKIPDSEIKSFSSKGLVKCGFCKDSGDLFSPVCSKDPRGNRMDFEFFEVGNMPTEVCKTHILCLDEELLEDISLIKVQDRIFPKDIHVLDEEYVYRDDEE